MNLKPAILFIFLLASCIEDPPRKGKEVWIQNQSARPLMVLDSLTGNYFKLYDTATVNGRRFITRQANYITEYGLCSRFFSEPEVNDLQSKNISRITLYLVDENYLQAIPDSVLVNHLYRSFDISLDTLKKYELNHLFITNDTVLFEHSYDYFTNRKY